MRVYDESSLKNGTQEIAHEYLAYLYSEDAQRSIGEYGYHPSDEETLKYEFAIIRPEFVKAFKSDNKHFENVIDYAPKGYIEDISFHGNRLGLRINVSGAKLITHRSMERRPVRIGEEMNVIVYRLFAIK